MSSSGLVTPPASSAARRGKDTSYVPTFELVSSTWPWPSWRPPFQAVRAIRVGMRDLLRRRGSRAGPGAPTVTRRAAPRRDGVREVCVTRRAQPSVPAGR
ncbi:Uncharacterised protein [Mycobacteroides abscessus]|nr:Uncharacterised protein [Mycobacteroides abscessus]